MARMGKPSRLWVTYLLRLIYRTVLFVMGLFLFVKHPQALSLELVGGIGGFNFVDLFFISFIVDLCSKFFPRAKLAMGSLKQFPHWHAPTTSTFDGGRDAFLGYLRKLLEDGRVALESVSYKRLRQRTQEAFTKLKANASSALGRTRQELDETRGIVAEAAKAILVDVDVLRVLPFDERDLTAEGALRHEIRRARGREILPVIIFWLVFNTLIALALRHWGYMDEPELMLWSIFYFFFDVFSVVVWCPLQIFMMRNRCCTTCQIFNWDGIMAATPLFLLGGIPSWIVIGLALVVLLRWEITVALHPERFDERTNASLRCANCTDKLCYLRAPLRKGGRGARSAESD